ncbi:MAG TPA: hypothetical protein VJW23_01255 [Propionibacteriaceae bacterium]|nr:hypothetical protein [Propionibacteriaceae bacterium]
MATSFRPPAQHAGPVPVNKNMATGDAPTKTDPAAVQIFKTSAMINPGVYSKPIPFDGMGKPVNENGFSDHFPTQ